MVLLGSTKDRTQVSARARFGLTNVSSQRNVDNDCRARVIANGCLADSSRFLIVYLSGTDCLFFQLPA